MRSVELFAGCGGLALGIARAGFKHAMVVEKDPQASATLRENRERGVGHIADWHVVEDDVRNVKYRPFADKIDLVAGGPPCQPFSIGGKHLGPEDERNMWPEAIRAVRELRPKAFLFENVRGLLRPAFADYLRYLELQLTWPEIQSKKPGQDWRSGLKELVGRERLGKEPTYRVLVQGINTADYGAPQKRHRAIVIGVRSDVASELKFPKPTHSREALLWDQWISEGYWKRHDISRKARPAMQESDEFTIEALGELRQRPSGNAWTTVRDVLCDLPAPRANSEPIPNHRLHPGARVYARHTGSVWDQPAKALKAGDHGVPGGENVLASRNGKVRYFTLREMARLQGFPDEFVIGGSWKGPIKQLGNAVPVEVGAVFGREIARLISPKESFKTASR